MLWLIAAGLVVLGVVALWLIWLAARGLNDLHGRK
jgi:hypothetical protein